MTHTAFLLHRTDAVIPREGPSPFDLPPSGWQDGDRRSFLVREGETNPYNGAHRLIQFVRAPNPDPWPVRLEKGVGLSELISDPSTFLVAVSEALDTALGGAVSDALDEVEPVSLSTATGKRAHRYRMGTLSPRDAIATHVDFGGSVFDLVDLYDFPRLATAVARDAAAPGQPYPVVEAGVRFADLDAFKTASREAINALKGTYVPVRLALTLPRMPALFHLDHGCLLASAPLAEALNKAPRPGAICPYPPISVTCRDSA